MPLYYGNIAANGITVTNNGAAVVPSTIVSAPAQTSDFFDITYSGGNAGQMFSVIPASSTTQTNGVQIQTSASGGFPLLKTVGSDGNIALAILAKGAGNIAFGQAPTNYQLNMGQVANAVDYLTVAGSATGNPGSVSLTATGSDTNVDILLAPKGNGQININPAVTATSATAGANGDVPAQVVGYLQIKIGGTTQKIPYYAV